ncbi:MAG TPA: hypothetical protein VNA88_07305, partial [Candidatus Kapabacteria bacterium]|nr:hypothetical protein [Candidatus Kapabacteria bacterium]
WLVMNTVGAVMQDANWVAVVEAMVERSGGAAVDGVQQEKTTLDDSEKVEEWIKDLIAATPPPAPTPRTGSE